ncbi:type II toxin-antitoxin system HicA family toxin [Paenibacillus sp. YPG26]|uniref:type II toxin-antitoxin system HicA family toxin n=1 Tax=Paenibacillus sp. YPG26 TaxID=2878915 RepID=UPI0021897D35|nr:type II toxin-antitoxin system HicA family toxin [Paenibacillus sp. YPG26]
MPSWKDQERWLKKNGWTMVRNTGRDIIYEKTNPDGSIMRTAVSKGTGEIGKGLFRMILKNQLGIDKDEWDRLK